MNTVVNQMDGTMNGLYSGTGGAVWFIEGVHSTGAISHYVSILEDTIIVARPSELSSIRAEDYPALAEMWDNDADAIYDNL